MNVYFNYKLSECEISKDQGHVYKSSNQLYFLFQGTFLIHMALSSHTNPGNMRRFQIGFLLIILSLFIFQTQSIKFFSKKPQEKANKMPDTASAPKAQDQDHKQSTPSKPAESAKYQDAKPPQPVQKPVEVKPQTDTSSSTPKPEEKVQPKQSTDKSLDTLFGQSGSKKTSEVSSGSYPAPAMTVKAQEHKSDATSVPASSPTTVATSPQPDQKAKESTNMIGGLFGDQKEAKPSKADTPKDERPKVEQQPKTEHKSQAKQATVDTKTKTDSGKSTVQKQEKSTKESKQEDTEKNSENVERENKKSGQKQRQEQSSGDVYYPTKKDTHKQKAKIQTKAKQEKKKAEEQSQTEQDSQIDQKSQKSTPQPKQDNQQSQSQQVIYPKKSLKTKTKTTPTPTQQSLQQSKQKYSLTLFMTFCLYSFIIVLVVITIKCTSSSSKIVRSVELMFGALWNMFLVKKGYRKMAIQDNEEEVTQKEDQITVGYTVEDNNKQIFWEKNSVEGI